jgi:methionine-rich copper-binding protein CopC
MVKSALVLCVALLIAPPALACGIMEKADPKVGSTVESADHVTLKFSQVVVPASSSVKITDAAGNVVMAGRPVGSAGDTVLSLKTSQPLAPGKYKVSWNVLWIECGSIGPGTYKFTVKGQ